MILIIILLVLAVAIIYVRFFSKSKDGFTWDEVDSIALSQLNGAFGGYDYTSDAAQRRIERIKEEKRRTKKMGDQMMRSARMKWLDYFQGRAEDDLMRALKEERLRDKARKAGIDYR